MRVQTKAIMTDVFHSEKSGLTYYSFADIEHGGMFSLALDGEFKEVKPGVSLVIDAEFKPRILRGGGIALTFVRGKVEKIKE